MKFATLFDLYFFVSKLSVRKIWNGFIIRLSYRVSIITGTYIHWGKPESLSIEPTNLCNLKCPECPSGNNRMTRPRLFLPEPDFKKAVEESAPWLSFLQLYFQGEPFLHPKFIDFIGFASSKNIYTSTSTNGHFLTHENCQKIVQSGLNRLVISIDGTTQESFEKYRVGGSLDLVVEGITRLIEAKKALKKRTPYIIIQFVVFSTNEHQINEIRKLARSLQVDSLKLKSAQIEDYKNGNPLIPSNPKYSRYKQKPDGQFYLNRNENFKCRRIWQSAVISAQGELLPCCFDKNSEHLYNSIKENDIGILWKGTKVALFRKRVWNRDSSIKMCSNCTEGLKRTWF